MAGWIKRALGLGARAGAAPVQSNVRTLYHWRCACGAHSRGGDLLESNAEYNAQRHVWRSGVGHPTPEIYSSVEEVP